MNAGCECTLFYQVIHTVSFAVRKRDRNRSRKNAGRRKFGDLVCFQCYDHFAKFAMATRFNEAKPLMT
jgi:hypothetical protein